MAAVLIPSSAFLVSYSDVEFYSFPTRFYCKELSVTLVLMQDMIFLLVLVLICKDYAWFKRKVELNGRLI